MGRGKGAAVDEEPSTSRFSGRHFATGSDIHIAVQSGRRRVRYRNNARERRREPTARKLGVERSYDFYPPCVSDLEELAKESGIRSTETEIDDIGFVFDGEIERLCEAQRVASGQIVALQAGAQSEQSCAWRDPNDT